MSEKLKEEIRLELASFYENNTHGENMDFDLKSMGNCVENIMGKVDKQIAARDKLLRENDKEIAELRKKIETVEHDGYATLYKQLAVENDKLKAEVAELNKTTMINKCMNCGQEKITFDYCFECFDGSKELKKLKAELSALKENRMKVDEGKIDTLLPYLEKAKKKGFIIIKGHKIKYDKKAIAIYEMAIDDVKAVLKEG